jgi:hypothetical protein
VPPRPIAAAFASFALAAAIGGCGTSSLLGSESATDTVRAFLEAAAAHDGPAACGLLNGQGQRAMAAYPARPSDPDAHARTCQQTVSRLGRLPGARDWQAMAQGRICVYGSAGRDSQPITVIFEHRGIRTTVVGSVQSNLGPGFRIMVPPTPPRPGSAAASTPAGSARCSSVG